jgi:integrase
MISLGIPTMYITRRLGHSSDDMVKRVYGHLIHDKQEDINRQMTEYFR